MLVVTWNVNGLRARWDEVAELARTRAPDVLCLQEIKASAAQVPEPLTGLPDYHNHYHGGPGGYSGVSIHVRRDLDGRPTFSVPDFDFENRIATATLESGLTIASCYVPSGGKDYGAKLKFLGGLASWAPSASASGLIIAGDLNVALTDADVHKSMRKEDTIGQRASEREILSGLVARGFNDVVRESAPESEEMFTWWPPWRDEKNNNRGWRIDFVLARTDQRAEGVEIWREFGSSDHAPVAARFGLSPVAESV